jgi:Uncharacterized conserved protein (DUF2190)
MSDYVPVAEGPYSYTASAAITGGQLVELTGNAAVQPSSVTSQVTVGVAAFDAASGAKVTVFSIDKYHETTVASGQSLSAGNPVKAGAGGTVQEYVVGTDPITAFLGVCVVGATAGNLARWKGY